MTYGTDILRDYHFEDAEHRLRYHQKVVRASGRVMLPNGFSIILQKVVRLY